MGNAETSVGEEVLVVGADVERRHIDVEGVHPLWVLLVHCSLRARKLGALPRPPLLFFDVRQLGATLFALTLQFLHFLLRALLAIGPNLRYLRIQVLLSGGTISSGGAASTGDAAVIPPLAIVDIEHALLLLLHSALIASARSSIRYSLAAAVQDGLSSLGPGLGRLAAFCCNFGFLRGLGLRLLLLLEPLHLLLLLPGSLHLLLQLGHLRLLLWRLGSFSIGSLDW
mmetsp:Transcript_30903/g.89772  ORF Transcript_30903/g.89772 Transcript_30903/m.89772 type:complete len:227 (-) Transcript_30903:554-1234(-)